MKPWEEMQYFDFARVTPFTVDQTVAPTIALSNPMRTVLVFQNFDTTAVAVCPDPPALNPGQKVGFLLTSTTLPLIIDQKTYGIMCQEEWKATGLGPQASTISVIEITMSKWPKEVNVMDILRRGLRPHTGGRIVLPPTPSQNQS